MRFRWIAAVLITLAMACRDAAAPPDRPSAASTKNVQLLVYRGGAILPSATVQNIYWGPRWTDPAWAAATITGLDSFAAGYGGSPYAAVANEYDGINGPMTAAVTFAGHLIDSAPVPKLSGKPTNDTQVIVAEVCRLTPSPPEKYVANVYVDQRIRGGYCAFHGTGLCGRYPNYTGRVYVAFYWNLDATSAAACMVPDDSTGHSATLGALANFTAHELSETRTDPFVGTAWLDANGDELADKCNDVFPSSSVWLANGSHWKVQGLWSNAASGCVTE